jgi:hypothetical protein
MKTTLLACVLAVSPLALAACQNGSAAPDPSAKPASTASAASAAPAATPAPKPAASAPSGGGW